MHKTLSPREKIRNVLIEFEKEYRYIINDTLEEYKESSRSVFAFKKDIHKKYNRLLKLDFETTTMGKIISILGDTLSRYTVSDSCAECKKRKKK
jgi:hypothetical protein